MRFMVLVKADADSESGKLPDERLLVAMGKFNEELVASGAMLTGEGLHPTSKGARMRFSGAAKPVVTKGPFPLSGDLVAGFWVVEAESRDAAIDLFRGAPFEGGEIELRQVFEPEDFEPAVHSEEGRATLEAERDSRRRSGS